MSLIHGRCRENTARCPRYCSSPHDSESMIAPFEALAAIPFQLLLLMFAGWVNRHQLDVIEYLQEENRMLKQRMRGQRLRFTDAERRRLAR
jgi:hypothetical protein